MLIEERPFSCCLTGGCGGADLLCWLICPTSREGETLSLVLKLSVGESLFVAIMPIVFVISNLLQYEGGQERLVSCCCCVLWKVKNRQVFREFMSGCLVCAVDHMNVGVMGVCARKPLRECVQCPLTRYWRNKEQ